jgi:hypothetical protein
MALVVSEGAGFIRAHQVMNNAAREGARFSVQPENSGNPAAVVPVVVSYATENGVPISDANVTVDQTLYIPTPSGISISASRVTVTYAYPLTYLPGLSGFGVPATIPLTAYAEFRNFY